MILVNGRVSERSFGRWRLLPRSSAALLDRFDMCLAQSSANARRLDQLGAPRVSSVGNLKLDVPAPPVDPPTLHKLSAIIGSRVVIAAASTHAGEESAIIAAHRRLRVKCPSLLTVIAPRHPARGPGIAEIGRAAGLAVALRSRGDPPKPDIDVYIADTLGELGLIYRLGAHRVHRRVARHSRRSKSDRGNRIGRGDRARSACLELRRDLCDARRGARSRTGNRRRSPRRRVSRSGWQNPQCARPWPTPAK